MKLFAWVGGRTFVSLRNHRNYRLYFISHGVSFAGTWMQQNRRVLARARADRVTARRRLARVSRSTCR